MNKEDLSKEKCVACEAGVKPFNASQISKYIADLKDWNVINNHHLTKSYKFPDFKSALKFVDKVGKIAEKEGHHPDISLSWGKVEIKTYTHAINGLSLNDFILASKIDKV